MQQHHFLPTHGILLTVCSEEELPIFIPGSLRPEYIPQQVSAILPTYYQGAHGFYQTVLVEFASDLEGTFARIAAAYAAEREREETELSFAEKFAYAGESENME